MTPNALVLTVARDSLMLSQGLLSKYFGKSHVISRVRLCEVGASTCELLPEFLRQFVSQLRRLSQGGNQNQATLQSGLYIREKEEISIKLNLNLLPRRTLQHQVVIFVDQPICGHLAKESLLNLLR